MVTVLGDPRLHEFIGGAPASLDELRDRYRRLVGGSGDPAEEWLNWIVRITNAGTAIGTLQATISTASDGRSRAHVAWVIGVQWQGNGYAPKPHAAWLSGSRPRCGRCFGPHPSRPSRLCRCRRPRRSPPHRRAAGRRDGVAWPLWQCGDLDRRHVAGMGVGRTVAGAVQVEHSWHEPTGRPMPLVTSPQVNPR